MDKIAALAKKLLGLTHLRNIRLPEYPLHNTKEVEAYFRQQLTIARHLHEYNVRHRLRSSIPALLELIEGTQTAAAFAGGFRVDKNESGNILQDLQKARERLPKIHSLFQPQAFPDANWLWDLLAYQQKVDEEIALYQQIAALARQLTPTRERDKARQLRSRNTIWCWHLTSA